MHMKGFTRKFKPIEILTEAEFSAIHEGVLDILEVTGVTFKHERALKLFDKCGCKVDYDEKRVRIPRALVEDCLRNVPSGFRLKARDPKNDLIVGPDTVYFHPYMGLDTVDLETWETRRPTKEEFYNAVKVLDALDTVHLHSPYVYFGYEGLPPIMAILDGVAAKMRGSTKVQAVGTSDEGEIFEIQMAKAVGVDIRLSLIISPPLTYDEKQIEAAYRSIEADFPLYVPVPDTFGMSTPATLAGALAIGNAGAVAGIVLTQLIKPGAKVIAQSFTFPQNMRSGVPIFGAIETYLHAAALAQYFRSFGIPVAFSSGSTNSKRIDFQCGYEKAIGALIGASSGANFVYFHGGLYAELSFHPVQAILDDDVASIIGRFLEGIQVDDERLAIDLIEKVGPLPGFFLNQKHTREWWKKEQLLPKATDRLNYSEWMEIGKKSCLDYAKERMEEILATHRTEPLTAQQEQDIERILKEARKYYRKKGLL